MPDFRSALSTHPTTGEVGIWFVTDQGVVGLAKSAFPANPGGPAATRLARWQQAINDALSPVGEVSIVLQPGDDRLTSPEPFCRVSGTTYICKMFIVTVTLTNLSPLTYEWRADNGAAGVVRL